jgi:hypothetical protein
MNEPPIQAFTSLAGMPIPDIKLPRRERQKKLDAAVEWLRNKNLKLCLDWYGVVLFSTHY